MGVEIGFRQLQQQRRRQGGLVRIPGLARPQVIERIEGRRLIGLKTGIDRQLSGAPGFQPDPAASGWRCLLRVGRLQQDRAAEEQMKGADLQYSVKPTEQTLS